MVLALLACAAPVEDLDTSVCTAPGQVDGVVRMFEQAQAHARVTVWSGETRYQVLADEDGVFSTTGLGELRLQPMDNGESCQGPEKAVELEPCEALSVVLDIDPDTCVDG